VTNDAGEATSSSSDSSGLPEFPTRNLNRRIAVGSGLFGVGLFVLGRLDFGVSLKDLSAVALPYEEVCLIKCSCAVFFCRLSQMGSRRWWSSMQIGARFAES
ncbi:unnamed protein product, partial [Linum tenue]